MFRLSFALALSSLLLAPSPAAAAEDRPVLATPGDSVQSFFTFHLAHDMGFSREGVDGRAAWLSPDLLSLCRKYLARPSSPDVVPSVDGDPFTDSQEYPTSFKVGKVRMSGGKATVEVFFAGPETNKGRVHVLLVQAKGAWLIDDVRYSPGPTFRKLLAE
jgi:hypothetical protein